jgi:tRNA A-37 threonylcarbamoyl transferase component Bud32
MPSETVAEGGGRERDLLFGLLALQMDFVTRSALAEAVEDWKRRPGRPLDRVLLERGAISAEAHGALGPLVLLHLRMHGDDAGRSLASLPTAALEAIGTITDAAGPGSDHATITFRSSSPTLTLTPSGGTPDATRALEALASAAAAPAAGGRFRVLRPYARGGLGQIHVALDEELGREVALKEILPQHADDPASRARFLMEASITGAMEHPGLVPVYGLGRGPDGRPYYAMRLIKGESLKEAIARLHSERAEARARGERPGPLGPALRPLLRRLVDVCDAIEYAHSRGVIHRDLKPANIMLGPYGETLVVDWGLAKPLGRSGEAAGPVEPPLTPSSGSGTAETLPGRAVGTPAYMSPEQAAGDPGRVGPASDVYSLGATLYGLLTGRAPFGESDVLTILSRVQRGDFPPPRSVLPEVPRPLEAVCLKAMALEPGDRYPSARALEDDLERWLADEPVVAWREPPATRLARWARRRKSWALAAALALLSAAAVSGVAAVNYGLLAASERSEREEGLGVAAKFAARTVAAEIDRRWRILEAEAADRDFVALLAAAEGRPLDSPERRALQRRLAEQYARSLRPAAATNWFVTDAQGVQLARAPFSATSVGTNYAFRDYFHGLGRDLPEGTRGTRPIERAHRSIVFRSQATGGHMVTFSVPVWSDATGAPGRRVLGVLGMSVDLGRFGVLQLDLGDDQVAVLADLRPDESGTPGLILHHPWLARFRGHPPVFHLDPPRVARLEALRRSTLARKRRLEALTPEARVKFREPPPSERREADYRDPIGGPFAGPWLAAFEPVIVEARPSPIDDTGWVVLVQERPRRADD